MEHFWRVDSRHQNDEESSYIHMSNKVQLTH